MAILYETIDFDPKASVETVALPPDYLKTRAALSILNGSFEFEDDGTGPLCVVIFTSFEADVGLREGSMYASVALQSLQLVDSCTPDTAFSHIVASQIREPGRELVKFSLEMPPLDGEADVAVSAALEPLDMVYSPFLVRAMLAFAKMDADIVVDPTDSRARLHRLEAETQKRMAQALAKTRTKIDVNVNLRAPTIKVPQDCTDAASAMLVLDGGVLRPRSLCRSVMAFIQFIPDLAG